MTKRATFRSVAGLNKALRRLPKEANARLRDAAHVIAGRVADDARARADAEGGLAAIVSPTIKASRDRVPVVKMGGSGKLPESGADWQRKREGDRQTVGDVIWGAEFGGGARPTTHQFKPWRGNDEGAGYFLWPAVRQDGPWIDDQYSEALNDALGVVR